METLFNALTEGVMLLNMAEDRGLYIADVNRATEKILGLAKADLVHRPISDIVDLSNKVWEGQSAEVVLWQGELWYARLGEEKLLKLSLWQSHGPEADYLLTLVDYTEHYKLKLEIEYLSYRDKLTGLYNLRYLMDSFEQIETDITIFYIDLDGFTRINDTFGHVHGDKIIKIVASRLLGNLRGEEQVARVGGDKFALWGPAESYSLIEQRGKQLLEVFRKPLIIDGQNVRVTVNVGFATGSREDAGKATSLIRAAELASKQAKHRGLNRLSAYDSELATELQARYRLDRDIKGALDKDEFYLKFQPVVKTHSGEPAGFEALARWRHSELGEISPGEFIPVAEQNGAITAIGDWVLAETFNCLKTINDLRTEPIYGAVNISIRQLEQEDFVRRVVRLMDRYQIEGKHIELEVTESVYMENLDAIFDNLKALNELGIRIAIDDFGTGYSALSQLYRLDVGKIKIDKSFIDGLAMREESERLTEAVTLIAKSLNLELVAEGVETEAQLERLKHLNCDYIQGYYFSKPLSLKELFHYLGIES